MIIIVFVTLAGPIVISFVFYYTQYSIKACVDGSFIKVITRGSAAFLVSIIASVPLSFYLMMFLIVIGLADYYTTYFYIVFPASLIFLWWFGIMIRRIFNQYYPHRPVSLFMALSIGGSSIFSLALYEVLNYHLSAFVLPLLVFLVMFFWALRLKLKIKVQKD